MKKKKITKNNEKVRKKKYKKRKTVKVYNEKNWCKRKWEEKSEWVKEIIEEWMRERKMKE